VDVIFVVGACSLVFLALFLAGALFYAVGRHLARRRRHRAQCVDVYFCGLTHWHSPAELAAIWEQTMAGESEGAAAVRAAEAIVRRRAG
jgi:hypothetical protein